MRKVIMELEILELSYKKPILKYPSVGPLPISHYVISQYAKERGITLTATSNHVFTMQDERSEGVTYR